MLYLTWYKINKFIIKLYIFLKLFFKIIFYDKKYLLNF